MSLRAFHIFFIIVSTLLAAGFAVWCFENSAPANAYSLMGKGSAASAAALFAYLVWFLRKSKGLGASR